MDDLDTQGMLAQINAEIAKVECETRDRIARLPDDLKYAEREWEKFNLTVAHLRKERDVLVTMMARSRAFEAPPRIILQNNP